MTIATSVDVIVSPMLPIVPSLATDVVRMVRHGLADVLEWLGEDVGPKPGEEVHAIAMHDKVLVSQAGYDHMLGVGGSPSLEIPARLTPAR
jgi:hypothetical protein